MYVTSIPSAPTLSLPSHSAYYLSHHLIFRAAGRHRRGHVQIHGLVHDQRMDIQRDECNNAGWFPFILLLYLALFFHILLCF